MAYAPQHIFLAALLQFTSKQKLIQDKVRLLKVEDDVQFTHVAIVLVHLFNVSVDDLQSNQFVVGRGTAGNEEKGRITAIDNFGVYWHDG